MNSQDIKMEINKKSDINFKMDEKGTIGEYPPLLKKPKINDVTLLGNKTSEDLGLQQKLIEGDNVTLIDNGDGTTTISSVEGSGSSVLASDLTVSNPLGKYKQDDVIDKGTELETIFRGILSKTYYPSLTNPSCSMSYSAPTLAKVGQVISSLKATLTFNRGSINPKYTADSSYRAGEANNYSIILNNASVTYEDSNKSGTFTVPSFTRDSKGNVTLNATVSYDAGCQPKDSDGNDYQSPLPAGNVSASKTVEFILPFYYGTSDTTDISSLNGLTEDLTKKGNKTYYLNANNQHLVIVYDSSYGNLKSIIDANNFDLIDGWTKSTKTIEGQSYNVYVSNKKNTDTNIKLTFNF